MSQGILETILANQSLIMAKLGITSEAATGAINAATGPDTTAPVTTAPSTITGNTPANVTPPTTGGLDVDSAGYHWDASIHSSSKEKLVKDSTWKLKRGVDQNLVAQVYAAQRAAGYGVAPAAATAPAATVQADVPATNTVPGAAAPAAGVNLPGMPGLPGADLPVTPAKVKVEMPAYVAGAEVDDTLLTTIASAFYAEYGEANLTRVLTELFKLQPGQPVTAIAAPEHRDSFWRLVTTPDYLTHYQIFKPQA